MKIDADQLDNLKPLLEALLKKHRTARYVKLANYYEGEHDILGRTLEDKSKPNNKLVINKAGYITDTITGYFMGKPISYNSENDQMMTDVADIFNCNDESDHNAELAKTMSIKGRAFELLYVDEDANLRFVEVEPENMIYVESNDANPVPLLAARIYDIDDVILDTRTRMLDAYTSTETYTFRVQHSTTTSQTTQDGALMQVGEPIPHVFGDVPVVRYQNNKEMRGDFEGVLSLIDAYNLSQSETMNDFEYFTDAYLLLIGMNADKKDIAEAKQNRVIMLDENGQAQWLIKNINDVAVENYKNRLQADLHGISKTPDLSDENFSGNLTGVAISYKIWGMEQLTSIKERKFKKGLQRRIDLICNFLAAKGKNYDWRDVEIVFSRNMPQNVKEIVDTAVVLKGIVSDETLLSQLPFVEDVSLEIERLAEQNEGMVNLDAVTEPEVEAGEGDES